MGAKIYQGALVLSCWFSEVLLERVLRLSLRGRQVVSTLVLESSFGLLFSGLPLIILIIILFLLFEYVVYHVRLLPTALTIVAPDGLLVSFSFILGSVHLGLSELWGFACEELAVVWSGRGLIKLLHALRLLRLSEGFWLLLLLMVERGDLIIVISIRGLSLLLDFF